MSIWVACVATWGHDGNQVQVTARDYVWVCGPVRVKVYNVHGPWCCHRSHRHLGSRLPPIVILVSEDHAVAETMTG